MVAAFKQQVMRARTKAATDKSLLVVSVIRYTDKSSSDHVHLACFFMF